MSTATVLNVHETVGIQPAGPATVSTCNVRFETVRLGLDSDEGPLLAVWMGYCTWHSTEFVVRSRVLCWLYRSTKCALPALRYQRNQILLCAVTFQAVSRN